MAIYTGGMKQEQEARAASKRIAAQQRKAQAGEAKRKGRAGLFGKIGGTLLGAAAVGLTGLTGGLAAPLVMGVASSLGKKWADEATKGAAGKWLKTPGQVGKIEAGGKYGYGVSAATEATGALKASRKTEFSGETMLGDIASSYVTAGLAGELGGAKDLLKGKAGFGEALTGTKDWGAKMASGQIGGLGGVKSSMLDLLPGTGDSTKAVDPSTIDLTESLEGSGLGREQYDRMVETAQAGYTDVDDFWDLDTDIGQSYETDFAQGGQVMDKNTLMGLALLSQMQQQNNQKTYDDTPLEVTSQPTIAEHFGSQNKTLGGSSTKSLSQLMGR